MGTRNIELLFLLKTSPYNATFDGNRYRIMDFTRRPRHLPVRLATDISVQSTLHMQRKSLRG